MIKHVGAWLCFLSLFHSGFGQDHAHSPGNSRGQIPPLRPPSSSSQFNSVSSSSPLASITLVARQVTMTVLFARFPTIGAVAPTVQHTVHNVCSLVFHLARHRHDLLSIDVLPTWSFEPLSTLGSRSSLRGSFEEHAPAITRATLFHICRLPVASR